MGSFFTYGNTSTKVLYFVCLGVFILYYILCFTRKKYVFSIFQFTLLFFSISLFIVGPFQFNYNIINTLSMSNILYNEYINKCYSINLLGFLITYSFMIIFSFFGRPKYKRLSRIIKNQSTMLHTGVLYDLSWCCVVAWYVIIIFFAGGIPLFTSNRTFAMYSLVQPIYLSINALLQLNSMYFLPFIFKEFNGKRKYRILFSVMIITLLFTGTRLEFLLIMYTLILVWQYFIKKQKSTLLSTMAILRWVSILAAAGLVLVIIRGSASNKSFFDLIFNDNSFSDIRDGSWILYGYERKFSGFMWGKNYLASLISFIPSTLSSFKRQFSAGSFTTEVLFGWKNHYGLRGGLYMMPYINFGYVGVICCGLLLAYWFSFAEEVMSNLIYKHEYKRYLPEILFSMTVLGIVFELIYAPSGFHDFWAYVVEIVFVMLMKQTIKNQQQRFCRSDN